MTVRRCFGTRKEEGNGKGKEKEGASKKAATEKLKAAKQAARERAEWQKQ